MNYKGLLRKVFPFLERKAAAQSFQTGNKDVYGGHKLREIVPGSSLPPHVVRQLTGIYEIYLGPELEPADERRYGTPPEPHTPAGRYNAKLPALPPEPTDDEGRAIISGRRLRYRMWQLLQGEKLPTVWVNDKGVPITAVYKDSSPPLTITYSHIAAEEKPIPDSFPITALKRDEKGEWHVDYKPQYPKTLKDVIEDSMGRVMPELTREDIEERTTPNWLDEKCSSKPRIPFQYLFN